MAMATDAAWVGHFCVDPGILVSNHVFLCRTGHFWCRTGPLLCRTSVMIFSTYEWTVTADGLGSYCIYNNNATSHEHHSMSINTKLSWFLKTKKGMDYIMHCFCKRKSWKSDMYDHPVQESTVFFLSILKNIDKKTFTTAHQLTLMYSPATRWLVFHISQ